MRGAAGTRSSMHTDSEAARELADRTRELMEEVVLLIERDLPPGATVSEGTVTELREGAREAFDYPPSEELEPLTRYDER